MTARAHAAYCLAEAAQARRTWYFLKQNGRGPLAPVLRDQRRQDWTWYMENARAYRQQATG